MVYALINNGVVVNTIVADEAFIASIQANYDNCIRVDELEVKPSIGWTYADEVFSNPNESE